MLSILRNIPNSHCLKYPNLMTRVPKLHICQKFHMVVPHHHSNTSWANKCTTFAAKPAFCNGFYSSEPEWKRCQWFVYHQNHPHMWSFGEQTKLGHLYFYFSKIWWTKSAAKPTFCSQMEPDALLAHLMLILVTANVMKMHKCLSPIESLFYSKSLFF